MIEEDYVSFETAKLLKEKGFDGILPFIYVVTEKNKKVHLLDTICNYNDEHIKDVISAPTFQMVMKWLREVHKIEVRVIYDNEKSSWYGACNPMNEPFQILLGFNCESNSYEEACESAIKYCLENLI